MLDSRNLRSGKGKYLMGFILLMFISAMCAAFTMTDREDFAIARREVLLRKIGHELLLHSGDSTSRVQPVKKITKNEYQISFENEFSFQPDSLMRITQRLLAKDPLGSDYVVNVLENGKSGVTYGYAMSKDKKDDIVACVGRKQPSARYLINIKFKPGGMATAKNEYVLGGLSIMAFVGLIYFGSTKPKPRRISPNVQDTGLVTLGSMLFDAKNRKLIIDETTIELTGTETRVLQIFAATPNETLERSRLQKEVWEDEGVIVGRSLDMFISKLRKKLELDPNSNIIVVRGKGYKLEINS
ncbi:MAG: winged helix-turn-helix domain-containing protein [Pedobacter sp.]